MTYISIYWDISARKRAIPTLRVKVVLRRGCSAITGPIQDKDLLVLGTFSDLQNIPRVTGSLPLTYADHSFALSCRARWAADFGLDAAARFRRLAGTQRLVQIWPHGIVEGTASPFGRVEV